MKSSNQLIPILKCPHIFQSPPVLRPFDMDEFLKTVEHSGPQLTSGIKGDWQGLYHRFFRSSNFEGWYKLRQHEVNQKLQVLHLEVICEAVSTTNVTLLLFIFFSYSNFTF